MCIKVSVLTFYLMRSSLAYKRKYSTICVGPIGVNTLFFLEVSNDASLTIQFVGIALFEFWQKYILLMFILTLGSNIINLLMLTLLVRQVQEDKNSIPIVFLLSLILINILHMSILGIGLSSKFGVYCSDERIYRKQLR